MYGIMYVSSCTPEEQMVSPDIAISNLQMGKEEMK